MRDLSLRTQLILVTGGVVAGAVILAFAISTWADVRLYRREAKETGLTTARVVAGYTVADLAFRDRKAATESLAELGTIPSLEAAFLYDARGELFATFGGAEAPAEPPDPRAEPQIREGWLEVVEPVTQKGRTYGTLHLRFSTDELWEKIRRDLLLSLLILTVVVFGSLLVALRLQKIVSDPILDLARVARKISLTGDYSVRVEPGGSDEIGALRESFNDMLDQIQKRERERDEAEHRTREKSRFLANMSHELRTPLNSIIGFSEILLGRTGSGEPTPRRFLENIHSSGQHLLAIINDILDISKVEAGHMELHPQAVDVREVLEGVVRVMRGIANRRQVEILLDLPAELPEILADRVKLKQIFYNLVSNAVKFSHQGGVVEIRARVRETSSSPLGEPAVAVSVRDEGIGIAAEDQERIFRAFQQVDATRTRPFTGTGLGLALTKTFVDMHQGELTLESEVEEGSLFRVLLPIRDLGERGSVGTRKRPAPLILVVEDDPNTFERLFRILEGAGFEPLLAKDAEEALETARNTQPDAVTLDLLLPGDLDGFDVLRRLKGDPETATIPIVIFSRLENQELGFALGADDYFLKPVDFDRMVRRLKDLVSGPAVPRILLVDEDRMVHELLHKTLAEGEGYRVEHAYTGKAGLRKARLEPPDVALVAMTLEDLDAFRVVEELRRDPRTEDTAVMILGTRELDREERDRLQRSISALLRPGEKGREVIEDLRDLIAR